MKSNKGKSKVLYMGRNPLRLQETPDYLQVLADHKPEMLGHGKGS